MPGGSQDNQDPTDAGVEIEAMRQLIDCVDFEGLLVQADALRANRPLSSTPKSVELTS